MSLSDTVNTLGGPNMRRDSLVSPTLAVANVTSAVVPLPTRGGRAVLVMFAGDGASSISDVSDTAIVAAGTNTVVVPLGAVAVGDVVYLSMLFVGGAQGASLPDVDGVAMVNLHSQGGLLGTVFTYALTVTSAGPGSLTVTGNGGTTDLYGGATVLRPTSQSTLGTYSWTVRAVTTDGQTVTLSTSTPTATVPSLLIVGIPEGYVSVQTVLTVVGGGAGYEVAAAMVS